MQLKLNTKRYVECLVLRCRTRDGVGETRGKARSITFTSNSFLSTITLRIKGESLLYPKLPGALIFPYI